MKKVKNNWKIIAEIVMGLVLVAVDSALGLRTDLFKDVYSIIFETLVVVAGFWVTLYLLFLELYKDRYPLRFLESKYLIALKQKIKYVVFASMYGLLVMIRKDFILESCFYLGVSIYTILTIGRYVYDTSKTIMVTNYVQEYCNSLSKKFDNNDSSIEKEALDDLNRVFEECIIKEEYAVAHQISNCSGNVFRDFMDKSIKFIRNGEKTDQVEESFKRIAKFGAKQLKKCKDIESTMLVEDIISQQYKNLEFCVETKQFVYSKIYLDVLIELTRIAQRGKEDKIVDITFDLYKSILDKLLEDNSMPELVEYMVKKLYEVTTANSYFFTNEYIKHFMKFIIIGLDKCQNDSNYEYMFEKFENFTIGISRNHNGFSGVIVFYMILFDKLKEAKPKYFERYIELVLGDDCVLCNDEKWIEYKFHCLSQISNTDYEDKVEKYHLNLLMQIIELKDLYRGYVLLPNFEQKIYGKTYSKERVDDVCDNFCLLFNQSIVSDNIGFYYTLLKKHDECMLKTLANQKDIQEALLSNYIWLIKRTRRINNIQFLAITFESLEEVIKSLDKDKKISNGFTDIIFREFEGLALQVDSQRDDIILRCIDMLYCFGDYKNSYLFCSRTEKKKILVRCIYNIGINCVENDYEEGVRKASNCLGWLIIGAIDQGVAEQAKYTLELAKKMLDISKNMQVSTKTETFLVTLFTTVGMYCYKNLSYTNYQKIVIDAIKDERVEVVDTAIEMRTYENNDWDSLMDNKTQEYAKKFKGDFRKVISVQ